MVSSTPRPHFTPGKDPVPILQEAGWAPGPVWTGGKSRPHRDSIPDRPVRSQLLHRLSYPAHFFPKTFQVNIETLPPFGPRLFPHTLFQFVMQYHPITHNNCPSYRGRHSVYHKQVIGSNTSLIAPTKDTVPIPDAARSKAQICFRSPAEIVGSNPTGGMDVCLL